MAAELRFDFSKTPSGQAPAGFTNVLAGEGKPGDWRVIMDEVPPLMAPLTEQAPAVAQRSVLAQLSQDPTDERFPMLIYQEEQFGDFTLTTRFKIVSGQVEQMAGVAFRVQDADNYYYLRVSALGRNVRFYKVVKGGRALPINSPLEIKTGEWHELRVKCSGSEIRCAIDGQDVFPPLNDTSFRSGRIGFWTKSDSVSYFADTEIQYTPQVPLGQRIINEVVEKNPRLIALKLIGRGEGTNATRIIASTDKTETGQPAGKYEADCLETGQVFFSKNANYAAVVMPVRDRNGDVVAAARVHLTTFFGQTELNAVTRARQIVNAVEARVWGSTDPLTQ